MDGLPEFWIDCLSDDCVPVRAGQAPSGGTEHAFADKSVPIDGACRMGEGSGFLWKDNFHLVFSQEVFYLQQVSDHLWARHQLPIPWRTIILCFI